MTKMVGPQGGLGGGGLITHTPLVQKVHKSQFIHSPEEHCCVIIVEMKYLLMLIDDLYKICLDQKLLASLNM